MFEDILSAFLPTGFAVILLYVVVYVKIFNLPPDSTSHHTTGKACKVAVQVPALEKLVSCRDNPALPATNQRQGRAFHPNSIE